MASFENALIGGVASSLANVAVYPLDVAKTLVQTQLKEEYVNIPTPDTSHVLEEGGSGSSSSGDEGGTEKERSKRKSKKGDKGRSGSKKLNRVKPIPFRDIENIGESQGQEEQDNTPYKNALDVLVRIYKKEGIKGLYRGLGTSIVAGFLQSFSYFFWYSLIRKYYFRVKLSKGQATKFTTPEELLLGIVAAGTSQFFVNPVNVIATTQQTRQGYSDGNGVATIAKEIYRQHNSLLGFWRGLKVSLVLTINPSITYATYEKLKDVLYPSSVVQSATELLDSAALLSPIQNFILGVLSKIVSTLITQPLIVAKASLQKSGTQFDSMCEVLAYLYTNEGIGAYWKGILPQITKGVLVQGLLFMFKGELTKLLRRLILYVKVVRARGGRISF
ncbi:Ant1p Ecym_4445 [Eremothecium cymbalariae DBVPG|uniref:Uncharacterized protein n=1 Tax=Eremothecium cymbalariae (strain CBS 270.75 / DBVPG 7215 / KCTC 17166 / NRRL Y-17582) TaxID=931890 RepID=G8JTY7_ERECY|nr:hypothetical protein Ecym_4445 [Eremothecium cymbalariae DBVPG\